MLMPGLKDKSMSSSTIDHLIINSPCEEATPHWRYDRETSMFSLEESSRLAGYVAASESSNRPLWQDTARHHAQHRRWGELQGPLHDR